jgi:threonine aldolase
VSLHDVDLKALNMAAALPQTSALPRNLVDLFSDTMTRPSQGMRKAMAEAEVGDEQRGEDPTTRSLEDRIAELLGKEAAVFLPSGTMCNQIAIAVHCRSGDEIIAPDNSHLFTFEGGGGAAIAGAQNRAIPHVNGIFTGTAVAEAVRNPAMRHSPRSRVVAIEQTMNLGGGAVWSMAQIEDVAKVAKAHGLILHMDGARLPNAAVASGVAPKVMCAPCDTTWLDLSKGLGCPVGGVLAGSKDFIADAWRWKHRLGGAMRQSGILAAAGLYALDNTWDRLAEDHANAKAFASLAAEIKGIKLVYAKTESNLVFLDVSGTGKGAAALSDAMLGHGVRIGAMGPTLLRAVTHLDVDKAGIQAAGKALRAVVAA